jgi:hypothetical protein
LWLVGEIHGVEHTHDYLGRFVEHRSWFDADNDERDDVSGFDGCGERDVPVAGGDIGGGRKELSRTFGIERRRFHQL